MGIVGKSHGIRGRYARTYGYCWKRSGLKCDISVDFWKNKEKAIPNELVEEEFKPRTDHRILFISRMKSNSTPKKSPNALHPC
ncbi:hypothetical protein [Bacillus sp. 1P02SD]|uniref:hypothetical protein n=1 Tax=Bacillus sp. 1P02SD TaxID=3132264 RepID=UPI00399F8B29